MSSIVDDIKNGLDDILGLRDEIGAIKYPIYILTRTWTGEELGEGVPSDSISQILPSPYLVDYSHSLRIVEGGNIQKGDLLLKMVSKESYPNESDVNCSSDNQNIEKFYFINDNLYNVKSITSDYVYWNVLLTKTGKTKTYLP